MDGTSLTKILDYGRACESQSTDSQVSTWPKLWTPILHIPINFSLSLRLLLRGETMLWCEKWRGRLCYASSMACHYCVYNAFSPSPQSQRDFINKTILKPSSRSKPVLISSICNARASYNTLVFEVLLFSSLYVNMQCTIYNGIIMYRDRVITMFQENTLWLF